MATVGSDARLSAIYQPAGRIATLRSTFLRLVLSVGCLIGFCARPPCVGAAQMAAAVHDALTKQQSKEG